MTKWTANFENYGYELLQTSQNKKRKTCRPILSELINEIEAAKPSGKYKQNASMMWRSSLEKQNKMLKLVLEFYHQGKRALEAGVYLKEIENLPIREKIARAKFIPEDRIHEIDRIHEELVETFEQLISTGGALDA